MTAIPKTIGDYRLREVLGRGSYGTVMRAVHRPSQTEVAIKVVKKTSLEKPSDKRVFEAEVATLKRCNHPLLVSLYDILEDDNFYYLVIEYLENGSILQYVNKNGALPEARAEILFGQLISAIEYLHNNLHVAHRDIKAENVLLDANYNIRIIDFGLSHNNIDVSPLLSTTCGSPAYAAPEIMTGMGYTSIADLWSLGVVMFTILVGRLPFYHKNHQVTMQLVLEAEPDFPETLSEKATILVKSLLCKYPAERMTLEQCMVHEWGRSSPDYSNCMDDAIEDLIAEKLTHSTYTKGKEDADNWATSREATLYRITKRAIIREEMMKARPKLRVDLNDSGTTLKNGKGMINTRSHPANRNFFAMIGMKCKSSTKPNVAGPKIRRRMRSFASDVATLPESPEQSKLPPLTEKL